MFRNYFTRIMSQVVRKLIYPELVEIRLEIEKIDVASEFKLKESIDSLKKGNLDIQRSIEEIGAKLSDDILELRASTKKGDSGIDTLVQNIVHKELSELDSIAHKRDAKQSEKISDLRDMTENSYERIRKRDAKQSEKISDLHNMTESCYEKLLNETEMISSRLNEDMRNFNKRLDDLYKIVVKRDEHSFMVNDVQKLRQEVELLKRDVINRD